MANRLYGCRSVANITGPPGFAIPALSVQMLEVSRADPRRR
uniref:Uncharacterized protein n=1 Tax=Anopheles albimanus TaxID=7167 RepID=A0A182FWZ9_ANOAL